MPGSRAGALEGTVIGLGVERLAKLGVIAHPIAVAQGRVLEARTQSAALNHLTKRTTTAYGFGAVLASEAYELNTGNWKAEEFRPDGFGNVWYNHTRNLASQTTPPQRSTFDTHGLLTWRRGDVPTPCSNPFYRDTLYQTGDSSPAAGGNVIRSGEVHDPCIGSATQRATNSYYTVDNRLAFSQQDNTAGDGWSEYWYDALGRRVLERSRRDNSGMWFTCNDATVCISYLQRTVWDGNQVLVEEPPAGSTCSRVGRRVTARSATSMRSVSMPRSRSWTTGSRTRGCCTTTGGG